MPKNLMEIPEEAELEKTPVESVKVGGSCMSMGAAAAVAGCRGAVLKRFKRAGSCGVQLS